MRRRRGSPQEATRRHFDRWATTYEADRRSRWIAPLQDEAFAALRLESGDRLLDVGCGSGAAVRRAAAMVERAVGVDASEGMLTRARELAHEVPNAEFAAGVAERLPFPDAAFTALLCTTAFHHFPDPEAAVHEMARVLAPEGRISLGDGCSNRLAVRLLDRALRLLQPGHIHFYRSSELESLLDGAGFTDLQTRKLWDGGYAIVVGRNAAA